MGLLPYTQEHAMGGRNVLQMLPIAWKESSVFRVMQARLASYETQLEEATAMIVKCLRNPVKSKGSEGIPMQRLANLILDEHGWYLLLQGDFTGAYENFSSLYKDTVWLKPLYACLMAACCWEADDKFHNEAAKLMRDLPGMISGKKTNPTPMENFALRLANDFITNGQKEEPHQPGGSEQSGGPPSYADVMKKDVPGEAVAGQRNIPFQSRSKSSSPKSEDDDDSSSSGSKFHHTWAKGSKVLCRYLLALCQRSLGDLKQAEANFRYVVSQTDVVPGNVVPYACFEWGSMLLSSESTSPEGLNLLEKSIDFPSHEFQTRLKFVVSERLRMFRRACENDLSSKASTTSALNLRRVSELLRTVQIQPK